MQRLAVFLNARPDEEQPALAERCQPPGRSGRLCSVIARFVWWFRCRRRLRRLISERQCAGYSVSDAVYEDLVRRARAYADGNGD